jgi:hypothetical protein
MLPKNTSSSGFHLFSGIRGIKETCTSFQHLLSLNPENLHPKTINSQSDNKKTAFNCALAYGGIVFLCGWKIIVKQSGIIFG